jgi:hypothetical protein
MRHAPRASPTDCCHAEYDLEACFRGVHVRRDTCVSGESPSLRNGPNGHAARAACKHEEAPQPFESGGPQARACTRACVTHHVQAPPIACHAEYDLEACFRRVHVRRDTCVSGEAQACATGRMGMRQEPHASTKKHPNPLKVVDRKQGHSPEHASRTTCKPHRLRAMRSTT